MNEYYNDKNERRARWETQAEHHKGSGHVWTGLFLLVIGGLALVKSFGVPFPNWLFSWQMLLIAIGLFIGFRKGFRDGGWFVPIIIGGAFLVNDYFMMGELRRHIWPLALVVLGVFFIFRARRSRWNSDSKKKFGAEPETITPIDESTYSKDDFIDTTCIFGGAKKIILSKNFKGGDLVNIFGGSEIDLTQADINGAAELEVTAIFGGATLIVPSNWIVRSEAAVTVFGGIGDKRRIGPYNDATAKTLIIKGTVIFGGIEIKSF